MNIETHEAGTGGGSQGEGQATARQVKANRRNARKSTGPRTAAGRAVSRLNAVRHGALARTVLVRSVNLHECDEEFAALYEGFRADLQPVGAVEELLVDQVVATQWRLRRVWKAEAGEIALSVDEGEWQRTHGAGVELEWQKWHTVGDATAKMMESARGNGVLASWLREVRSVVEEAGELTKAAGEALMTLSGGQPNRLTHALEELRVKLEGNPEGLEREALRERNREEALGFLDERIGELERRKAICALREAQMEGARQAAATLPAKEVVDKILRYETKLGRQLFRALFLLERAQRRRQGEKLPPPVVVEMAHGE